MSSIFFYVVAALFIACGLAILVIAFADENFRRLITGFGKDINR